jgi:hypothetical protein
MVVMSVRFKNRLFTWTTDGPTSVLACVGAHHCCALCAPLLRLLFSPFAAATASRRAARPVGNGCKSTPAACVSTARCSSRLVDLLLRRYSNCFPTNACCTSAKVSGGGEWRAFTTPLIASSLPVMCVRPAVYFLGFIVGSTMFIPTLLLLRETSDLTEVTARFARFCLL